MYYIADIAMNVAELREVLEVICIHIHPYQLVV